MPYLRKVTKTRWYRDVGVERYRPEILQADVFVDLKTDSNALSLWYIEPDSSNLEYVAVALTTTADAVSNIDYVLLPDEAIADLRLDLQHNPGNTFVDHVNSYHRDAVRLTAHILSLVACRMLDALEADEPRRFKEKPLRAALVAAIHSGQVDPTRLVKFDNSERVKLNKLLRPDFALPTNSR